MIALDSSDETPANGIDLSGFVLNAVLGPWDRIALSDNTIDFACDAAWCLFGATVQRRGAALLDGPVDLPFDNDAARLLFGSTVQRGWAALFEGPVGQAFDNDAARLFRGATVQRRWAALFEGPVGQAFNNDAAIGLCLFGSR